MQFCTNFTDVNRDFVVWVTYRRGLYSVISRNAECGVSGYSRTPKGRPYKTLQTEKTGAHCAPLLITIHLRADVGISPYTNH